MLQLNNQLQSEQIGDLIAALSKAQAEIEGAPFDKKSHHNEYASYTSIREACRLPLAKNGLAVTHTLDIADGKRVLVTQLSHSSGQWMRSYICMPQEKETPQGMGSAITYSKRYALAALLAIYADNDDDGEAAEGAYKNGSTQKAAAPVNTETLSASQCEAIRKAINGDFAYLNKIVKEHKKDCIEKVPASQFTHIMHLIKMRAEEREYAKTGS
jgi:ERF superfamily protein